MNTIDIIEKNAYRFKLETQRVNNNTVKLYSKKYLFDNWLIVQEGKRLKLLHMSKRRNGNKCAYHTQRMVCVKNWWWLLQDINKHNKHVITRKWNARENLVDRVMREYKEGKYGQ
ncbi:hypothetical protein [Romboutsia sp.]|uniref:hypothetical protein n=1 Tax=Romboutsia sp. TaxID=1965302 RepID=UPI002CD3AF95|nr:hypothetical protein [Romboutsia sp.]HSQ87976.1 hypothetical protein [Romboutsia sp.]